MSEQVTGLQGEVLKWAREQAGYGLRDVAEAMKKDVSVIEAWEKGTAAPTYGQLEKLAYQLYKRPLAIFFFPSPPQEPDLKKSFRTLPDFEIDALSADTRYALRYARAMQLAVAELNEGVNRSERKIFADLKLSLSGNIAQEVAKVRQYLGITLEKQISWRSAETALGFWREVVEDVGIFVFKRSFKQKDVSGFCLYSQEFPLIYLNNSTAKTRQIFSLFHELAHILFHVNGVTKTDDRYIEALPKKERSIEIACNRFAAEFLVPSADFERRMVNVTTNDAAISSLADIYKVSREVILRKLLERGLVSREVYEAKATEWSDDYLEAQKESEGGNYYRTQAAYLGTKYLGLVFGKYYQGHLTLEQAADYLGVKTKSVAGLEHVFMSKAVTA
jgi:Zn-dependent peptidase ImmA (M78 family)